MKIEGVSPVTRLFLSEITEVTVSPDLYTRRANIKRAYMAYLKKLGVSIKLSPSQFYEEVVAYFSHLSDAGYIELDCYKGNDVIRGVMIPEFYNKGDEVGTLSMHDMVKCLVTTEINTGE